jgi:hypothetical protein
MSLNIVQALRSKSVTEASRLLGFASTYISDRNLVNILNQYDLNHKRNDAQLIQQLHAFAGVPGLKEQVARWLAS